MVLDQEHWLTHKHIERRIDKPSRIPALENGHTRKACNGGSQKISQPKPPTLFIARDTARVHRRGIFGASKSRHRHAREPPLRKHHYPLERHARAHFVATHPLQRQTGLVRKERLIPIIELSIAVVAPVYADRQVRSSPKE